MTEDEKMKGLLRTILGETAEGRQITRSIDEIKERSRALEPKQREAAYALALRELHDLSVVEDGKEDAA